MQSRLNDYGVQRPIHILPTGIPLARFAGGDRARFRAARDIAPDGRSPSSSAAWRTEHRLPARDGGGGGEAPPDLLLMIAGEGPALPALRAEAAQLGLGDAVRFTGYLDRHSDLPDCYAAADVFVFASRTETQGLVLLEAMAVGLPVVAFAEMGTIDILSPRRGCRVPAEDPAAFADSVVEILSDAALRAQLGREARDYAHSWSDETMAARLADLYFDYHHRNGNPVTWKAHTKARPA